MTKSKQDRDGIIVLGHPRSGTTLLRRLLAAHPNIACPGETHILNACARFLSADVNSDGLDMGVLTGLTFAGFGENDVLEQLREFAFSFPRRYAARKSKPRWAEKTAIDSFYVNEIERLCADDAYFVLVLRHGGDVAISSKDLVDEAGTYFEEFHPYIRRYKTPLLAFAHSWVDVTQSLLRFADSHPENCVVCRYEDLLEAPEDVLTGLLEFVGEQWNDALLGDALSEVGETGLGDWRSYQRTDITTTSVGRWESLPEHLLGELAEVLNATLEECGYETINPRRALSSSEIRRRYEFGLMTHSAMGAKQIKHSHNQA